MCRLRGLDERGTKEDMATQLMDWVSSGPSQDQYAY